MTKGIFYLLLFLVVITLNACEINTISKKEALRKEVYYKSIDIIQSLYIDDYFLFVDSIYAHHELNESKDRLIKNCLKLHLLLHRNLNHRDLHDLFQEIVEIIDENPKIEEWYLNHIIKSGALALKHRFPETASKTLVFSKLQANKLNSNYNLAEIYIALGNDMFSQDNHIAHIEFDHQGLKYLRKDFILTNDSFKYYRYCQAIYDNIGISYNKLGKYKTALIYLDKAYAYLDTFESTKNDEKHLLFCEHARAVIASNVAVSLFELNKLEEAEAVIKESIEVNLKQGFVIFSMRSMALLGNIYLEMNKFNQAYSTMARIKLADDTIKSEYAMEPYYELASNYYAKVNDASRAVSNYKRYSDSKILKLQAYASTYAFDLDQLVDNYNGRTELVKLNRQNEYQKMALLVIVLSSIVLLFAIFIYIRNNKKLMALNSKIKNQNNQLKISVNALEQSQKEKKSILKVVAHDLRTPMAGFISLAEILLTNHQQDKEARELLMLIKSSAEKSLDFVNDILLLGKNTIIGELRVQNVCEIVKDTCNILSFKALEKDIELAVTCSEVQATVDKTMIFRLLNNLISNAIKFSYSGSKIWITLTETDGDEFLMIVKDSGIGIPVDKQSDLFSFEQRFKRLGTEGEESFGIGLRVVQDIVKAHQGKLWFESTEKVGTTFYVQIPKNIASK